MKNDAAGEARPPLPECAAASPRRRGLRRATASRPPSRRNHAITKCHRRPKGRPASQPEDRLGDRVERADHPHGRVEKSLVDAALSRAVEFMGPAPEPAAKELDRKNEAPRSRSRWFARLAVVPAATGKRRRPPRNGKRPSSLSSGPRAREQADQEASRGERPHTASSAVQRNMARIVGAPCERLTAAPGSLGEAAARRRRRPGGRVRRSERRKKTATATRRPKTGALRAARPAPRGPSARDPAVSRPEINRRRCRRGG